MKFSNAVTIAAPSDDLFEFVSDIERVAPCLPGAQLDGRDGDDYLGSMKVKVGPIGVAYKGKLSFLELDRDGRRAIMQARAEEVAGSGGAEAQITTSIEPVEGGSLVRMDTDLQVRGRVAQFGRGAMEKIAERMIQQFAQNIERAFTAGDDTVAEAEGPEADGQGAKDGDPASTEPSSDGPAGASPQTAAGPLDAITLLPGDQAELVRRYLPHALVALLAFSYGYLLGRVRGK